MLMLSKAWCTVSPPIIIER